MTFLGSDMFRLVRTRPLRLRGERGLGQQGGFLVTKLRRRRPVLGTVSQQGGRMSSTLRNAYKKARAWHKPIPFVNPIPRPWRV